MNVLQATIASIEANHAPAADTNFNTGWPKPKPKPGI